jgi:hypothetical protein
MNTHYVDLFTTEEHVVVAHWLGTRPACDGKNLPTTSAALETLGFKDRASDRTENAAAVASIILERSQEILPQWASGRTFDDGSYELTLGREVRGRLANRKIELVPRHLLTIDWAVSGPGLSWPVAYHATWVPIYNQFVVTQSADCPDAFGYCDFAIGHFPETTETAKHAGEVIRDDWAWAQREGSQCHWAYVEDAGLISFELAEQLADEVWEDPYE